jgi:hypothetical protein
MQNRLLYKDGSEIRKITVNHEELIMADIAACKNNECPLRKTCYRYTCPKSEMWQAYQDFMPDENGECKHFIYNQNKIHDKSKLESSRGRN